MTNTIVKKYKGIKIKSVINMQSDADAQVQMKDALLDKIVDINEVEAPQSMVQNEISRMVCELSQYLKYEAMRTGDSSYILQNNMNDHMEKIKKEALRLVKVKLILKEIIQLEQLEITKGDLEEEVKIISIRQEVPVERVKDFFGEELNILREDLLIRKAINFIYDNAIIQ